MKTDFVLCSVKEELKDIDKSNLRMNGILMSDRISEAMQPLLEGEVTCLLLTDKVIKEQSSLIDATKNIKILYDLYPKKIRIIYIKQGIDRDSIINLMNDNGNWDVYYNHELSRTSTEDVVEMFQSRQIPTKRERDGLNRDTKAFLIKNANKLSRALIEDLQEEKDVDNNNSFKSRVLQNISYIRDLVLSFEELKRDLRSRESEVSSKDTMLEKFIEDLKDKSETILQLKSSVNGLEENRREMLSVLNDLHIKYNLLIDNITEAISISDVHTVLSKTLQADRYKDKSPIIIYFKEYTPLNYFTSYLQTFNEIITDILGLSRIMVIENDTHLSRIPLYEKKDFVYVTDGTDMNRIVLGNLVCRGNNLKLLNYMVQNSLQLDVLIIFDRTGSSHDLIEGQNVIKFSLAKLLSDAKTMGLKGSPIISNDPKGQYFVEEIQNYEKVEKNDDLRISIVNSLTITKKLIRFIRDWDNIGIKKVEPQFEEEETTMSRIERKKEERELVKLR